MGAAGAIAGLQGGLAINQAIQQSKAIKAQAKYQQQMADTNAKMAELQGSEALRRGEKEAQQIKKQGQRVIGAQRVALAAQGINLDEGTALELQQDTAQQAARDAVTTRNNAYREAWGYKVEALNQTTQGKFIGASAKSQSYNTLMTGGLQALGYGVQGAQNYGAFTSKGSAERAAITSSDAGKGIAYSKAFSSRGSA